MKNTLSLSGENARGISMTRSCAADLTKQINSASEDLAGMLKRAHDEKAWQALGYETWNAYVKAEIKLCKSRVFQLLDYETIRQELSESTIVDLPLPTKEAVTRELKKVEPADRPAVYAAAVEAAGGQQPTAKQVEAAANLEPNGSKKEKFMDVLDRAGIHANNDATWPPPIYERQTRPLTRLAREDQPKAWAAAVEAAGGQQPTARQVESAASLYTMPKELKAILAANEPIAFFHLRKSGELVPATNGRWFIWWTQLDADGVVGNVAGNKKADSAERVWEWFLEMESGNNRVAWTFIQSGDDTAFSSENDPLPWKYNHALFTSYDEHLEHVLGIRKGRK